MTCSCPTCGAPVDRLTLDLLILASGLSERQGKILRAIWGGAGHSVPTERLMNVFYADDPSGGPDTTGSLRTTIRFMRKKLAPFNVFIISYYQDGYRLSFTGGIKKYDYGVRQHKKPKNKDWSPAL